MRILSSGAVKASLLAIDVAYVSSTVASAPELRPKLRPLLDLIAEVKRASIVVCTTPRRSRPSHLDGASEGGDLMGQGQLDLQATAA